jgi:hypothetical protein
MVRMVHMVRMVRTVPEIVFRFSVDLSLDGYTAVLQRPEST